MVWKSLRNILCCPFIGGGFYLAHSEAMKSNYHYKMSAIIYRGNTIFAVGHNETRPPIQPHGFSLHAEEAALNALRSSGRFKMLVYRFTQNGHAAASQPCENCMKRIRDYKIKQVICLSPNNELIKVRP